MGDYRFFVAAALLFGYGQKSSPKMSQNYLSYFFFVFLKYICYSYFQFLAFPYGDVQSENFDPTQHIQKKKKMKINKKR